MLKKIFMLVLMGIILGGIAMGVKLSAPAKDMVDPLTYFNEFKTGQINAVYEDIRVDIQNPIIEDNSKIYISYEFANKYIDDKIFYDQAEKILTITNLEEVRRFYPNDTVMYVNGEEQTLIDPMILNNEMLYLPESYLEGEYGIDISKGADGRLVLISNTKVQKQTGVVKKKNAEVRTHPDKKALITDKIQKGHKLIIYNEEGNYLRVRDENGIIGYIPSSDVKIGEPTPVKEDKQYVLAPMYKPLNDKVKLVWDQMTVKTTGDWSTPKYRNIQSANVIAPTWFEFADSEGNLIDRASKAYVDNAHSKGMQVWALMSHNFTSPEFTKIILTSTAKRQRVIDQLLNAATLYGFDGINIDIENVQADFGNEWVQFMRELSVQAKRANLSVSVDIYMPSAWSGHYHRDKVAEVVDYFMVMAYDQHWSGGEVAGPVAGLEWVEEGIILNLQEVPKEKLVLGMPFYTRIWKETKDGLSSTAYGMAAAKSVTSNWNTEVLYDEEYGQDYMQMIEGDTLYQIWIEDKTTIAKRVELINKYNLAGYAGWKLGLETTDVWDSLEQMK